MTSMLLPDNISAESSAYNKSLHETEDSMSFTYIKKSRGPSIDPWGTPQLIESNSEL